MMVAVVALLPLVFVAFCTVTDADALLTLTMSRRAAAQATREKAQFIEARQCKENARPTPCITRRLRCLGADRYDLSRSGDEEPDGSSRVPLRRTTD